MVCSKCRTIRISTTYVIFHFGMFYIKDFVATMDETYVLFKLSYKYLFKHTKYLKEDQVLISSYR